MSGRGEGQETERKAVLQTENKTPESTTVRDRSPMEERRNEKRENNGKKEQVKNSDDKEREKATR
jgi:hypothetical protein